ncbi:MAG: hypothetical protein ACKPKO_45895 [Candidatus Fonsibacter sp.]
MAALGMCIVKKHGDVASTMAAIYEAYELKLVMAKRSEALTKSVVDMALTIYNQLLQHLEVASTVLQADAGPKYINPSDSITKLQLLLHNTKTCDNLF